MSDFTFDFFIRTILHSCMIYNFLGLWTYKHDFLITDRLTHIILLFIIL